MASTVRKKNYPIAVKNVAREQIEESSSVRSSLFDRAALSDELTKLATFKLLHKSVSKGISLLQFDKKRMIACSIDGTLNLWNWEGGEKEPTKIAGNVKNIICFQYDHEILVLGTAEGTVHLFDARNFEEKWSMRLGEPVVSLKFCESTLVTMTGGVQHYTLRWVKISRPDMRLLYQRFVRLLAECKTDILRAFLYPDITFVYSSDNVVRLYETKSGNWMRAENQWECRLLAPAGISTLNMGDLISTKRVVVAGCIRGTIAMWNSSKLISDPFPVKTFRGHAEDIVSLYFFKGHLLSLDNRGKLFMWSGHDLESAIGPVPRLLVQSSNLTYLATHERWFASCSSKDEIINIWTLPDLWLRTG